MAAKSTRYIPESEITRLIEGSYERLSSKVEQSLRTASPSFFGSELSQDQISKLSVGGTFKGYAIVHNEDRSYVYRVKYEVSESNTVIPISAESIPVKSYTHTEWVQTQARAYVEEFMSGARTAANERLKQIWPSMPFVESFVPAELPQALSDEEKLRDAIAAEKVWKKIFESKLAQIKTSIGEDITKIDESRLKPKFRKLHDGSLKESEVVAYKDLVTADLKYLSDRLGKLVDTTEVAIKAQNGAVPALKESTDDTLKMFESFSSDYLVDIKSLSNSLSEVQNTVNPIDSLAKIYDLLASELHSYEVAGKFIERMSNSLLATASETGSRHPKLNSLVWS